MSGSQLAKDFAPSEHRYLLTRRGALEERGVVAAAGDALRMAQDYAFDSPSTAAGVLLGRSANGRIEWRDAEGRTLKDVQATGVAGHAD